MDKWFDTGQKYIIALWCVSLLHIPLSSESYAHRLFEVIRKRWSALFVESYDLQLLGGVKLGVESFDAMYLDEYFHAPENIENRLDKSFIEYEHGLPVKELHSNDDKMQISRFIVLAKIESELSEHKVGSHLMNAQRQNKWTTWSSPAYFGCNILMKTLASLSPNTYSNWRVSLELHSCSSAGFVVYITFSNL